MIDQRLRALLPLFAAVFIDIFSFVSAQAKLPMRLRGGPVESTSPPSRYEIEPGGHLGWHTDATEETQYIIAGSGELLSRMAASMP